MLKPDRMDCHSKTLFSHPVVLGFFTIRISVSMNLRNHGAFATLSQLSRSPLGSVSQFRSPMSRRLEGRGSGEPEAEEGRDRALVEQTRRRKWRRPLPSRGNHRPLQGPLPGEQHLPVLGAYVRAQSVDPAVGGRAIGAQRALRGVYVEVVPTIGHLLPAGAASP